MPVTNGSLLSVGAPTGGGASSDVSDDDAASTVSAGRRASRASVKPTHLRDYETTRQASPEQIAPVAAPVAQPEAAMDES